MKKQDKIVIVTVTYNSQRYLKNLLISLKKQGEILSIIFVDNNSLDGTKKIIKQEQKKGDNIYLIENKRNEGFAKATNTGIKYGLKNLKADYFFLLNPDTVIEENLFKELIFWDKKLSNSVLCPKILIKKNKKIWWEGTKIFKIKDLLTNLKLSNSIHINKEKEDSEVKKFPYETEAITGCAVFFRKSIIEKIGYLDEKFFMYGEDLDYSLRLRKKGYKIFVIPNAIVYHDVLLEKESFKNKEEIKKNIKRWKNYLKSSILLIQKHFSISYALIWFFRMPFAIIYEITKRIK